MQTCHRCQLQKDFTQFYKQSVSRTGYGKECKACNYTRLKGRKASPAKSRRYHLKRAYGMSTLDEQRMLAEQNNRCLICSKHESELPGKRLHIDHCHSTGMVRGLLCFNCNQMLGNARDNEDVLEKAVEYLNRSKFRVVA